jgi:uncharacterized SAM-binding protein YcdF (DUF218 family)
MHIFLQPLLRFLKKTFRMISLILGSIALLMLLLCFTSLPFWADYHLGIAAKALEQEPEVIVVLGGSGMPSPNGLIRTYYAAQAALNYSEAKVIIALPGDTLDAASSVRMMANEMMLRGVDSSRIIFENEGTNTRWEALNVKQRFFPNSSPVVLLVSSPSHMYRSVKAFKKAGFHQVGGLPSFGRANESSLYFDAEHLGGDHHLPDVGTALSIRYLIWTRLHLQITVIREYTAIAYYWMMGWI